MSDITKCTSVDCPYKTSCLRQLDETNPQYQSWFDFSWQCNFDSGFQDYIRVIHKK